MDVRGLSRTRGERGAVVVEFALVLPVVLMVLIGTITTAHVYYDHTSATNAVREAARYGSATSVDPANQNLWAASVRDRLKQVYFDAGRTATDYQICARLVDSVGTVVSSWTGANCGAPPAPPPSMPAGTCAVLVWLTKPGTIGLVVFPDIDVTIGAQSVSFYGRKFGTTCTA